MSLLNLLTVKHQESLISDVEYFSSTKTITKFIKEGSTLRLIPSDFYAKSKNMAIFFSDPQYLNITLNSFSSRYSIPESTYGFYADFNYSLDIYSQKSQTITLTTFLFDKNFTCSSFYFTSGNSNTFVVSSSSVPSNLSLANNQKLCFFSTSSDRRKFNVVVDLDDEDDSLYRISPNRFEKYKNSFKYEFQSS